MRLSNQRYKVTYNSILHLIESLNLLLAASVLHSLNIFPPIFFSSLFFLSILLSLFHSLSRLLFSFFAYFRSVPILTLPFSVFHFSLFLFYQLPILFPCLFFVTVFTSSSLVFYTFTYLILCVFLSYFSNFPF